MIVRRAGVRDTEAMILLALDFAASALYSGVIAPTAATVHAIVDKVMHDPASAAFVLEGRSGHVVGMIAVHTYPHPISQEIFATELVWWVDPAQRGSGRALLNAAEAWAKHRGAVALQMIAPTEQVERVYAALGFAKLETIYQKRLA